MIACQSSFRIGRCVSPSFRGVRNNVQVSHPRAAPANFFKLMSGLTPLVVSREIQYPTLLGRQ
jgi:hypothetical protein